jgi:RHS repeat-associated protein
LANLSTLPIIQAADNVGGRIVAFWCRCGDLRSITDPENKVTTWIRDETRRVNFKIYPDLKQAAHTYEPLSGRLATMTDMSQQVTTRRYFADSSLKDLAYTNAIIPTPTVSFTYDAFFSRIETMSDGIGTTSYNYHPPGQNGALQVHTEDGPLTGDTDKITYTYDDLGRLKTRNIGPLGSENLVTLHYDGLGRLDDLTDTLGLFDYAYVGESSRLDYVSYPNGQKTDYDYYGATADHRLKQIKNLADGTNPASVLSQFDYTFFDDGKIHTIARQLGGGIPTDKYTFGYDDADQLETATLVKQSDNSPLKAFAYSYDPSANITSISRTKGSAAAQVTTFIPNDRNQITSMSGPRPQLVQGYTNEPSNVTINGTRADNADHNQFTGKIDAAPGANTVTATATDMSANANTTTQSWDIDVPATQLFSYDANGNLLSDGTRSYTWDAVNRLASVSMGVDTWTFGYDGLDRRVTESKNGTLMNKWLWCGTGICEERAPNDAVTKRYFTHGEERIGDWDAGEYFYTSDHLGSIRDVTATVGGSVVSVARYDFDPYGERQKLTGTTSYTCDFGFTGHHTHAATGLVLTLYRAYDPSLGVWLSADPIGENGGLNLYGYAMGNPVMFLDLLGLDPYAFHFSDLRSSSANNSFKQRAQSCPGGKSKTGAIGVDTGQQLINGLSGKSNIERLDIVGHMNPEGMRGTHAAHFAGSENGEGRLDGVYTRNDLSFLTGAGYMRGDGAATLDELADSLASSLGKGASVNLLGCNSSGLAQKVSAKLAERNRGDVTVSGGRGPTTPITSGGKDVGFKNKWDYYKGGQKVATKPGIKFR